jgi:hypothetical protein
MRAWLLKVGLPLRLTAACALSSLVYQEHRFFEGSIRIFGPLLAMVCSNGTLGATIDACWQGALGLLLGSMLSIPCVWLAYSSLAAAFACTMLGTMLILVPDLPGTAQKIAWLFITVLLNVSAAEGFEGTDPCCLSVWKSLLVGLLGIAATLVIALAPIGLCKHALVDAESLIGSAELYAKEATAVLCFSRSVGSEEASILTNNAEVLLLASEEARRGALALFGPAAWEDWLWSSACWHTTRRPSTSYLELSDNGPIRLPAQRPAENLVDRASRVATIQLTVSDMLICCQQVRTGQQQAPVDAQALCPSTFAASSACASTAAAQVLMVKHICDRWRYSCATFDSILAPGTNPNSQIQNPNPQIQNLNPKHPQLYRLESASP